MRREADVIPDTPERPRMLTTLAEWQRMTPSDQGYVLYMEEAHDGSELRGQRCPYAVDTPEHGEFKRGELGAVLYAQDSEE